MSINRFSTPPKTSNRSILNPPDCPVKSQLKQIHQSLLLENLKETSYMQTFRDNAIIIADLKKIVIEKEKESRRLDEEIERLMKIRKHLAM